MFRFLVLCSLAVSSFACLHVTFSNNERTIQFEQIDIESIDPSIVQSGRAIYHSNDGFYLYHIITDQEYGKWVVSKQLSNDGGDALAYFEGWAVTPYLVYEVTDRNKWNVFDGKHWISDDATKVSCDNDNTLFLETETKSSPNPNLSGYYIERKGKYNDNGTPLYSQVASSTLDKILYLYHLDQKWLVGEIIGDDGTYFNNILLLF